MQRNSDATPAVDIFHKCLISWDTFVFAVTWPNIHFPVATTRLKSRCLTSWELSLQSGIVSFLDSPSSIWRRCYSIAQTQKVLANWNGLIYINQCHSVSVQMSRDSVRHDASSSRRKTSLSRSSSIIWGEYEKLLWWKRKKSGLLPSKNSRHSWRNTDP